MTFQQIIQPTPNISRNVTINPIGIILHHTGGSYVGAVSWCLNSKSKVSYHCIVNTNGDRTILAGDRQRAWHAGKSSFNGRNDCNSFMLGIAVSGDTNTRTLTKEEVESVAKWCVEKIIQFNMPKNLSTITTHRFVSPNRKNDVDERAEKLIKDRIKELLK